jgi:hypothetical protein
MIIDNNFITKELIEEFGKNIFAGDDPCWALLPTTNNIDLSLSENTTESFQLVSRIDENHRLYDKVIQIFKSFVEKYNIKVTQVDRIKMNVLTQRSHVAEKVHHKPHVDSNRTHKVFLYYVNTCDGDTVIFNETYDGNVPNEFTERHRIKPQAGKAIYFNGQTYHASSPPRESEYRCVINIDFN